MSQFSVNHLLKLRRPADGTPFDSSPDGSQLAIDLSWGEEAVRRVVVVDTDTGVYRFPFGEETIACCPQWAPDGNSLAAYIQVESNFYPGVWNRLEDTWYLLENVRLAEPEWGFAVPRWTPDSRSVVVKLASVAEEVSVDREYGPAAIPNVKIQAFDPNAVAEAGPVLPAWMQGDRGDLARVDVKTGQIRVLTTDWIVRSWRVSPDGRAVATMRMVGRDDVKGANISDLMVIPLDGRKVRQVASGIAQSYATAYSWSSDSRHLAYVTGGSLFLVPSNGTRHPINISGKANGKLRNADPRVHLPPRWSSDGRTVYYPVYGGLWTLAVDGSTQRKYDAGGIDRQMLYWLQPPDGNHPVMADNQTIHVSVLDTESKNHGIARLDLESGRLTLVHERSCAFSDTSMHMETIGDGSAAFLALETAENPPEIWKFSRSSGEFRRFYVPNDDLDQVDMGKARLIEWEDGNGKPGKAALMLPPGYKDGETVPVVVLVYAGDDYSDYIHYFGFGGTYIDNAQLLTTPCYARIFRSSTAIIPCDRFPVAWSPP